MRRLIDRERLLAFMAAVGRASRSDDARVYLSGGASAVLFEWRQSTIDIDLEIRPERDEILRAIPEIKERLEVNVEIASPGHFIPEVPGWEERSPFIAREGRVSFHHYDFYAQALAKIERSHTRDLSDVREMFENGLVEAERLMTLFAAIEPQLYRYPAIDSAAFRRAVEDAVRRHRSGD